MQTMTFVEVQDNFVGVTDSTATGCKISVPGISASNSSGASASAATSAVISTGVKRSSDPRRSIWVSSLPSVLVFRDLRRHTQVITVGNHTPAMALASYVPMMMAADFVKGMIQGGGEQPEWKKNWDMVDYTTYAVQRAGIFGVGQFGLDMAKDVREGGVGVGALVGPTVEQFTEVVGLLGGHKQFGPMVLNALPANALYKNAFNDEAPDSPGISK